ncbi:hypothetical protein M413DRAFT_26602 [Hebeloma cylindrosporum]|uniref:Uncharacterized protein n=1 Tax=Hebeloma cylindrosporum TaxID=76867 RepID=A0A0C2YNH0_HEBCY|nr:hypothetical protein M413DRAFT_26602 [Hebeloma cylindrosporum h7]
MSKPGAFLRFRGPQRPFAPLVCRTVPSDDLHAPAACSATPAPLPPLTKPYRSRPTALITTLNATDPASSLPPPIQPSTVLKKVPKNSVCPPPRVPRLPTPEPFINSPTTSDPFWTILYRYDTP